MVAGVCGQPIGHSLSPLIHNAWLQAAGIDGVYVAFAAESRAIISRPSSTAMRGGAIRGVNVTIPFKEKALAPGRPGQRSARLAGAANLLIFEHRRDHPRRQHRRPRPAGRARSPGAGLSTSRRRRWWCWARAARRGARSAALLLAGAPKVGIVNRTLDQGPGPGLRASGRAWSPGPRISPCRGLRRRAW
jgi:shikimate dehydrogenase